MLIFRKILRTYYMDDPYDRWVESFTAKLTRIALPLEISYVIL